MAMILRLDIQHVRCRMSIVATTFAKRIRFVLIKMVRFLKALVGAVVVLARAWHALVQIPFAPWLRVILIKLAFTTKVQRSSMNSAPAVRMALSIRNSIKLNSYSATANSHRIVKFKKHIFRPTLSARRMKMVKS